MNAPGESPTAENDASLLIAMFEGTLDDAQYEALLERMRHEPDLRRKALVLAGDEETLREWAVAESIGTFRQEMNDEYFAATVKRSGRRGPLRMLASLTAIAACVAAFVYFNYWPKSEIATITRSVDVKWTGEAPKPQQVRLLQDQLVQLESGQLEITYDTGARVWLEGPVSVRLRSARSIELTRGRLAVDIDGTEKEEAPDAENASDETDETFTVITPEARVVDLGTRFALSVEDDKIDLVVYEGAVSTESLKTPEVPPVESQAGDAIRFDSTTGQSEPSKEAELKFADLRHRLYEQSIEASADHFVCGGELSEKVQYNGGGPHGDTLLLKRYKLGVCRKAWIRFDLSSLDYDVDRPATFVFRHNEPVENRDFCGRLFVYSLRPGYKPNEPSQGIDWQPDQLTWQNAPGNDPDGYLLIPTEVFVHGEIEVDTLDPNQPRGTAYSLTIERLGDILQEDKTATLILCVRNQDGPSANLSVATMDSPDVAGPELIVPILEPE